MHHIGAVQIIQISQRRIFYFTYNRKEEGDFYEDYNKKKILEFTPDIERNNNIKYNNMGTKYNLANPIK
jgi:hypothetical protein